MMISVNDLNSLATAAGLSSEQPLGHVALCLALRDRFPDQHVQVHRYSVALSHQDIKDSTSGMTMQVGDLVWEIGGTQGWEDIEKTQVDFSSMLFEQWCNKKPDTCVFRHQEVDPTKWQENCYVEDKREVLNQLLSAPSLAPPTRRGP